MLRVLAGIIGSTVLVGCSSTFFFLPETPMALDPGPGDYQTLIANDLRAMNRASMGAFEIAPLRQTRLAQPGDWFACVRTSVQDRPMYFAVFLREGKVIERRQAVVIDECAREQFQPLAGLDKPTP